VAQREFEDSRDIANYRLQQWGQAACEKDEMHDQMMQLAHERDELWEQLV
jgi:hypothetical protein